MCHYQNWNACRFRYFYYFQPAHNDIKYDLPTICIFVAKFIPKIKLD